MNFWQGKICPVCRKPFEENDDVVYCPDCGTAHHRDCWKSADGCFFAKEHAEGNFDTTNPVVGASASAAAEATKVCPSCGQECRSDWRVCVNCGHEFETAEKANAYPPPPGGHREHQQTQQGAPFGQIPFFGGFAYGPFAEEPEDTSEVIAEEVTAQDIVRYCGPEADKYLHNFKAVRDGKNPFNLAALFGSFFWLLYRKMLAPGLAAAAIVVAPLVISVLTVYSKCGDALLAAATNGNQDQFYDALLNAIAQTPSIGVLSMLFWVLLVVMMLVCGLFGNRLYYRKAVKDIRSVKQTVSNRTERRYFLAHKGGVSVIFPILAVFLFYSIINTLVLFVL